MKKHILPIIILILLTVDMIYTYNLVWKFFSPTEYLLNITGNEATEDVMLSDDHTVSQTFGGPMPGLGTAAFSVDTTGVDANAMVFVKVIDKDEKDAVLFEEEKPVSELQAGALSINFGDGIRDVADHDLRIEFSSKGIDEETPLILKAVTDESYEDGTCSVDKAEAGCDLSFLLTPASLYLKKIKVLYVAFMILIIATLIYVYIRMRSKNVDLARDIFLPVSIVFGIIYMCMLPPFTVPDERAHFDSAYALSNHMLFTYDKENERACREEERFAIYNESCNAFTYSYVLGDLLEVHNAKQTTATRPYAEEIVTGPVLMYGPAALGISIARILGLGYTDLIYWGRFFNLLAATACLYGAIKLMPFRKEMMFVASCLPITFQQKSSLSYDGMNVGLICLLTAYLLYLIYEKETFEKKDYILLALGMIFAAPVKFVYFMVAFLVLLIPNEKFVYKKPWLTKIAYAVSSVIFTVAFNAQRFFGELGENASDTHVGYTIKDVLTDIPHTFDLLIRTFQLELGAEVDSLVGARLGYFRYNFSSEFLVLIIAAIVLSLLTKKRHDIKDGQRVLFLVLFVLSAGMSIFTMLISWTPLDSEYIQGVQGRYYLPMLPLLLMCIPEMELGEESEKKISRTAIYIIVFVNAWMLSRLFQMIMLS